MDPASFAFSVASMLQLCIHLGKDLYARCEAYRSAERELQEANLKIKGHWIKIEQQLSALQAVWEALPGALQIHQFQVLQVLRSKLKAAVKSIQSLSVDLGAEASHDKPIDSSLARILLKVSRFDRIKYAVYAKESLEHVVEELEQWQRTFDPSWFFLSRLAVQTIDQEFSGKRAAESKAVSTVVNLRRAHRIHDMESSASIFVGKDFVIGRYTAITSSSSWLARTDEGVVVVDRIPIRRQNDLRSRTRDVRDLARILSKVDPDTFGLLSCRGVLRMERTFDLIFPVPQNQQQGPIGSLRYILSIRAERSFTLNERVKLASCLARSVVFLHSSSFVHKSITPENIIICRSHADRLGTPYLVGFDQFRLAEGPTHLSGDKAWERNIYRHPRRQGIHPEDEYIMQHDVYSLGVCLLEIGLWTSFVEYSGDYGQPIPGPSLSIKKLIVEKDQRRAAYQIKRMLVDLARNKLPALMGNIFTEVVVSCLTCLDKDNELFGDEEEFLDDDGISVGVRYIEKILFALQGIAV
ncbi:uncharacterized protein BO72DRAFT_491760 [Aspergillus fijiensis CBS 313.89]|uniref:Protein kinase domain-containing protein n=1 Tax=Aspergillus fijiensis CBS 313.89 TaxID=1448319 RepID=A0A8G1S0A3_9EURO|nr:uncharacterized protein BO72DRAFT_491760 [Aspergillus fijiensis CBS 313.89]RAK82139.1 hypothetical protein BO72DRAFT_491760 [Aspergillus fijiensis CBS 313.89]